MYYNLRPLHVAYNNIQIEFRRSHIRRWLFRWCNLSSDEWKLMSGFHHAAMDTFWRSVKENSLLPGNSRRSCLWLFVLRHSHPAGLCSYLTKLVNYATKSNASQVAGYHGERF